MSAVHVTQDRRAAVLGHPIAHSLSPVLHTAAYTALGLDWQYTASDVDSPELAEFLASCGPEWAGLSLTMPLKTTILEMLDHIEPLAEVVGAVNTVLFQHGAGAPGRPVLIGANTDVYGIVAAIREGYAAAGGSGGDADDADDAGSAGVGAGAGAGAGAAAAGGSDAARATPVVSNAVILGAGATAASALAGLGELGCHTPTVFVRSLARTGALRRAAHRMGVEPTFHTLDRALDTVAEADVVISTLPGGASDDLARDVRARGGARGVLLDVVYDPRPTPLASAWTAVGGTNVSGERMLLHQAGEQVRLMTGQSAPIEAMAAALEAALA